MSLMPKGGSFPGVFYGMVQVSEAQYAWKMNLGHLKGEFK